MLNKFLKPFTFFYPNEIEFKLLYQEIFKNNNYYVELDTLEPKILDCGGHIGMVSMYYKSLYPGAKIKVFEPLPSLIPYLRKNIEQNQLDDIEIIEKAIWHSDGEVSIYEDAEEENHWTSTTSVVEGAWRTDQNTKPVQVSAARLSHYLKEPIDILKMDIEGAETEVIRECQGRLKNVKHIMIEFHANRLHRPELILKILKSSGFTLTTYFEGKEIDQDKMTRRKPTLYLIEGVRE